MGLKFSIGFHDHLTQSSMELLNPTNMKTGLKAIIFLLLLWVVRKLNASTWNAAVYSAVLLWHFMAVTFWSAGEMHFHFFKWPCWLSLMHVTGIPNNKKQAQSGFELFSKKSSRHGHQCQRTDSTVNNSLGRKILGLRHVLVLCKCQKKWMLQHWLYSKISLYLIVLSISPKSHFPQWNTRQPVRVYLDHLTEYYYLFIASIQVKTLLEPALLMILVMFFPWIRHSVPQNQFLAAQIHFWQ